MSKRRSWMLITVVGVGLVAAGAVSLHHQQSSSDSSPPPITVHALPSSSELAALERSPQNVVAAPVPEVGEMDDGDQVVRAAFAGLSAHPQLVAWLLNDHLLRRVVVAVEMVAGGSSPVSELDFLRPAQPFVVERRGEELVISSSSFRRYDVVAEVIASLATEDVVSVYRYLLPRLEAVHREVAWYGPGFEASVLAALDHLLAVPIPRQALTVSRQTLSYAYADPELEALSDAQRHLLRLGPANGARVQAKLRELRQALAPAELPAANPGAGRARQLARASDSAAQVAPGLEVASVLRRGTPPTLELMPMAE